MKQILVLLLSMLSLQGCSGTKENNGPLGSTSAFIGSLVGRWTTGCVVNGGEYMKSNIVFSATSGIFVFNRYKDSECKVASGTPNGPAQLTYTIEQKPELGAGVLLAKEPGREAVDRMKAVLFDDSLSLTVFGNVLNFYRVPENK